MGRVSKNTLTFECMVGLKLAGWLLKHHVLVYNTIIYYPNIQPVVGEEERAELNQFFNMSDTEEHPISLLLLLLNQVGISTVVYPSPQQVE